MHARRLLASLPLGCLLSACRIQSAALPTGDAAPVEPDAAAPVDAAFAAERPAREAGREVAAAPPVLGFPALVGCSDGSREAFLSREAWPAIAGCAGAWGVPGLVGVPARVPACGRRAGDTIDTLSTQSCAAADLCAAGWHVCLSPSEVATRSPSGCEAAVPAPQNAFYAIAAGAASTGLCAPDATLMDDLHGCGTLGQPEDESCAPLVRRMGFLDCQLSGGAWSCGDLADHLEEAAHAFKSSVAGGGVLCCRDEP